MMTGDVDAVGAGEDDGGSSGRKQEKKGPHE
jgi:hypothetical protein